MGAEMKCSLLSNYVKNFIFPLKQIEDMVAEGLIESLLKAFYSKERDILAILARCDEAEMDVVKAYLVAAKNVSRKRGECDFSGISQ